jgi:LysR substrate binding domain
VGRRIELTEAGQAFLAEGEGDDGASGRRRTHPQRIRRLAAGHADCPTQSNHRQLLASQTPRRVSKSSSADRDSSCGRKYGAGGRRRRGRTAELGFVEGAVEDELFESTPVARDQLLIVVGVDHPWGGQGQLTLEDLIAGEWVLREPGSGTRSVFEEALARLGANPSALRVELELPSNEAVRAAVEAGLGATAISASVAAPSLEAGLLQQVAFRLPERELHVLRHRERYRSRAATALLEIAASRRAPQG